MARQWTPAALTFAIWAVLCGTALRAQDVSDEEYLSDLKRQIEALDVTPTDPVDVAMLNMLKNIVQHLETVDQRLNSVSDNVASLTEPQQSKVYLDILGNMDLDKTDHDAILDRFMRSVQGTLVVHNTTTYDGRFQLYIDVNGVRYRLPNESGDAKVAKILIPFGRVTTQLWWRDRFTNKWYEVDRQQTWPKDLDENWKVVTDSSGKQRLMLPLYVE